MSRLHPAPLSTRRRWLGFTALMLGLFTIISASTSVSTALAVIQHDLRASLSQIEWVVDSYLIVLTVFLAPFGRMGDIFGRKRMFIGGALIFAGGSAVAALARDANVLIAARALSGLGPAMLMPATLSLITDLFPPHMRGLPMGFWGSIVGAAVGIGPIMGGILVNNLPWQTVFWANLVLAGSSAILASLLLPRLPRSAQSLSLDIPGIVLIGGAIFSLSYALVEGNSHGWTSVSIIAILSVSLLLFVAFAVREQHTSQPMLDFSLFQQPAFTAGVVVTMAVSFSLLAVFVYLPLYLQSARHDDAIHAGLTLLPLSASIFLVGPLGGFLSSRVQPRWPIAAAMVLLSLGMFWLAHLTLQTTWQWLALPFIVIGCGLGISSANLNTAVMSVVPRPSAGAAAGVVATSRQLGSVLGVAVLGAILQNREHTILINHLRGAHNPADRLHAPTLAFTVALNDALHVTVGVTIVGALVALLVRQHGAHMHVAQPAQERRQSV